MRTPLIAGNWKMYKTIAEAVELAEALLRGLGDTHDREVLICPPYTALHALSSLVQETPISLGAQDVFYEEQGAYTSAISPLMLKDVGCTYTIIGHSERRQVFGDTDTIVNRKLRAALSHSLRGILCVGETKPQRDSGAAADVVIGQPSVQLVDHHVRRSTGIALRLGLADAQDAAQPMAERRAQLAVDNRIGIAKKPAVVRCGRRSCTCSQHP